MRGGSLLTSVLPEALPFNAPLLVLSQQGRCALNGRTDWQVPRRLMPASPEALGAMGQLPALLYSASGSTSRFS